MQLTFDADVEAFRAEFVAFLDEHLPSDAEALERSHSSSDVPQWARRWQRLMFENGWLCPGHPPEFGGRNATILQQYVHQVELTRRGAYLTFNPQGVGIIAASLISFGTAEQQQKWAIPILRADITASLGMSEPGAGSDLASLRTRAVRDGDEFVVNGQKVWTSGAHDADVLLTFVRTDPNAPRHKGISALMIPADLPGGTGWIPYFLERADRTYEMHSTWTGQDFKGKKPSEVFREHFLTCFISDPVGIKLRNEIGVDNICWEADYPHSDSMWPGAPEQLSEVLDENNVPDDEVNKMTFQNAMRWYHWDPFTHISREQSTVGALRKAAEGHDVSIQALSHKEKTGATFADFAANAKELTGNKD